MTASRLSRLAARSAGAVLAILLGLAPRAYGVVVSGMDPLPVPSNGYVGTFAGSSCVAVGAHWFITAHHVGGNVGQSVHLRGINYQVLEIRPHATFDVQLMRVAETLPGFHKLSTNPSVGDPCFLAGWGVTAAAPLANDAGWDWNGAREETWGANTIEGEGSLLAVRFDKPIDAAAVPHEAIFAVNDSGGGLFTVGADGSLELAGIAISVFGFGQAAWYTSAFSLNVNLFRTWMMPIVDPETPISSGVSAPRAMLGLPGVESILPGAILGLSFVTSRRRRG